MAGAAGAATLKVGSQDRAGEVRTVGECEEWGKTDRSASEREPLAPQVRWMRASTETLVDMGNGGEEEGGAGGVSAPLLRRRTCDGERGVVLVGWKTIASITW